MTESEAEVKSDMRHDRSCRLIFTVFLRLLGPRELITLGQSETADIKQLMQIGNNLLRSSGIGESQSSLLLYGSILENLEVMFQTVFKGVSCYKVH